MEVTFYSTHCPKCTVLQKKMDEKGVQYTEINDVKVMRKKGFMEAPKLEVDGELMDFMSALDWVSDYKGE